MNHIDCKYYLATDAFKGICKLSKETINADDIACDDFEKTAKCRHCKNFTETKDYLGLCMNKATAYPDMKAITCKDFAWN